MTPKMKELQKTLDHAKKVLANFRYLSGDAASSTTVSNPNGVHKAFHCSAQAIKVTNPEPNPYQPLNSETPAESKSSIGTIVDREFVALIVGTVGYFIGRSFLDASFQKDASLLDHIVAKTLFPLVFLAQPMNDIGFILFAWFSCFVWALLFLCVIPALYRKAHKVPMIDLDRNARIERLTSVAADRVVFDAELSRTSADAISCGIVFVHAFWAGSSRHTLRRFCESLVRVDPERKLTFVLCDIDLIQPIRDDIYCGDRSDGNGDIAWVRDGVVIARHNGSRECDFDTTTRSLLLTCTTYS